MTLFNTAYPLVVAPMAGGPSSEEFVAASCEAGALGSVGAAYMNPQTLEVFVQKVRQKTQKPFAINLFIPHEEPRVSEWQWAHALQATEKFRRELALTPPVLEPPYEENFEAQFEMLLRLKPKVFSYVFGLLKPEYTQALKKEKILLLGTATTLEEALALQDSGADAVTLQGFEAGGHRGIFDPNEPDPAVPLGDLLGQCRDKLKIPLIAAGGIMNSADIQKTLAQGAHAVQMGTAFLACQEAGTSAPYKRVLLATAQRKTKTTRAFSGRWARGIENRFMLEMEMHPKSILPFQAQNKFTRDIRSASLKIDSSEFLSLWAGTGTGDLWTGSVTELVKRLFASR